MTTQNKNYTLELELMCQYEDGRYTIVDTKMRKHESSMRIVFTCKFNPSIIHRINHIKTGDIFKTLYI